MKNIKLSEMKLGARGVYMGDIVELRSGGLTGGGEHDLYLALADLREHDNDEQVGDIIIDTDEIGI